MKKLILISIIALSMICSLSAAAFAAEIAWDGSENTGDWATLANWTPAQKPVAGDNVNFVDAGGTASVISLGAAPGQAVNNLTFKDAAKAYTIGEANQTLTLGGWGTIQITDTATSTETIAANVVISANGIFLNSGADTLNFTGSVTGTADGMLALKGTNTGNNTISGVISDGVGAKFVKKEEAGTWILSGLNTYTDRTIFQLGTLSVATIGNGGEASNVGASTSDAAHLEFDGGTLQYTGVTASTDRNFTINAGKTATIQVDGGTGVILTISGASTATNGALTKTGTGTLLLSGANTYTGVTTITTGTLRVSNANALGTGNVAHGTAGTLDIGSTTLNIGGTYIQAGAATLAVAVNGTAHGSIVATGAATVPATANLVLNVSNYVPNNTTYTIIDGAAGGAIVAPAITDNSALLTFAATTVGNDLILTATRTNSYNKAATDGNASAAGSVLEAIGTAGATGDMLTVLNELDNMATSAEIAKALDTVVPVVDSGVTSASNTAITQFIGTSMARLGEMFAQARGAETGETGVSTGSQGLKGFEAWGQGFGEYVHQKPRGVSNGYHATIWGTALGADIPAFNEKVRLGLSGGYAQSNINSKDNSGKTDVDSYQGTLYGGYMDSANPYYLNGAFSFAYNTYKGSRHIAVGTIVRTADADYDGQQYSVLVDGGYIFNAGKFRVTPIASLQYLRLHLEGYTESGANALNLSVGSENYDMLQSGLGMKLERPFKLKESTIVPEVHARWLYDFIGDRQETTSTFSGVGGSFATQGFDPAQHSFNVGTKLTLATKWNWSLETNYDFEYKEDFAAHTGWANARYKF